MFLPWTLELGGLFISTRINFVAMNFPRGTLVSPIHVEKVSFTAWIWLLTPRFVGFFGVGGGVGVLVEYCDT